jgi:hypothetical protein
MTHATIDSDNHFEAAWPSWQQMDQKIFASHSRRDGTAFAVALRQQLIEQNFSIWRDGRLAEASPGPDNVMRNDDDRHLREHSSMIASNSDRLKLSSMRWRALWTTRSVVTSPADRPASNSAPERSGEFLSRDIE